MVLQLHALRAQQNKHAQFRIFLEEHWWQDTRRCSQYPMPVVLKRFGSWATFVFQKPFAGHKNYYLN